MRDMDYQQIYEMMNRHELLDVDCGLLCSAACCRPDGCYDEAVINEDYLKTDLDDEMGIFLLPGEEKMTQPEDWQSVSWEDGQEMGFPASWGPVCFVSCGGKRFCKREKRPMQCRTFPFAPHLDEEDRLFLIYYPDELPYRCPIIEERLKVNPKALEDLYQAYRELLKNSRIFDLIKEESTSRIKLGLPIEIVWPQSKSAGK